MDCAEFCQRLQERLDRRVAATDDAELCRHASDCSACQERLAAWTRIASVLPIASPPKFVGAAMFADHDTSPTREEALGRQRNIWLGFVASGLAAALAVAVCWPNPHPAAGVGENSLATARPTQQTLAPQLEPLDPSILWRSVQNRAWIDQTMPAVRSVQQGVAPLGRSLLQAMTILTGGAGVAGNSNSADRV